VQERGGPSVAWQLFVEGDETLAHGGGHLRVGCRLHQVAEGIMTSFITSYDFAQDAAQDAV